MKSITMEDLFKQAGFSSIENMEINKVYDVCDKDIKIKSYNINTNSVTFSKVQGLIYKGKGKVYNLVLKDGSTLLKCSETHKVYDAKDKEFYEVKDKEELNVLTSAGDVITCFVKQTNEEMNLLDIEVEDNESYFSNGILSHNCTGGMAIRFAASTRNRISKLDQLKDADGNDAGIQIRVRNYKNKTGTPWRDAIMNLYFKGGFKVDDEYLDFLVNFGIIHKGGAWYDWTDTENVLGEQETDKKGNVSPKVYKWQGSTKALEWLKSHPEVYDDMKKEVDKKLLDTNELDADNVAVDEAGVSEDSPVKSVAQLAEEAAMEEETPTIMV